MLRVIGVVVVFVIGVERAINAVAPGANVGTSSIDFRFANDDSDVSIVDDEGDDDNDKAVLLLVVDNKLRFVDGATNAIDGEDEEDGEGSFVIELLVDRSVIFFDVTGIVATASIASNHVSFNNLSPSPPPNN